MIIGATLKKIFMATAAVAIVVGAFLVYALAGLGARPVLFAEPPSFVKKYATTLQYSNAYPLDASKTVGKQLDETESVKITTDFLKEEALVRKVFFEDESPGLILPLFAHPDRTQRVKIASAFSAVNVKFTHDEESGFPEKRRQFWLDVKEHIPNIKNALFEALAASAKEGSKSTIPYTLAWMPGQDHETVEFFAWSAKHHPDQWVRRFSVYFVVEFGENEELASSLLQDRTHDPDYGVRREVLDLRIKRLTGQNQQS
ncbi:hypothetical protein [Aliiglaciecola sp. M165]|uniref:hypothetical protein n=1 Tax=Aliiglaciecola sp. M165 TaxID=2593649 RepID=UPI0011803B9A|nr:hypothetical protein [Aliiglaciecola sp. M165]TRY32619.1 hypothetical protein FM019_07210 [Aliiglaciecola sp. M165]